MVIKLFRAELTATGRPLLLSGEVERGMLDKASRLGRFGGPEGALRLSPSGSGQLRAPPAGAANQPANPAELLWVLQVDLVFHGPGGVAEQPSDEYRVRPPGSSYRRPLGLLDVACHCCLTCSRKPCHCCRGMLLPPLPLPRDAAARHCMLAPKHALVAVRGLRPAVRSQPRANNCHSFASNRRTGMLS